MFVRRAQSVLQNESESIREATPVLIRPCQQDQQMNKSGGIQMEDQVRGHCEVQTVGENECKLGVQNGLCTSYRLNECRQQTRDSIFEQPTYSSTCHDSHSHSHSHSHTHDQTRHTNFVNHSLIQDHQPTLLNKYYPHPHLTKQQQSPLTHLQVETSQQCSSAAQSKKSARNKQKQYISEVFDTNVACRKRIKQLESSNEQHTVNKTYSLFESPALHHTKESPSSLRHSPHLVQAQIKGPLSNLLSLIQNQAQSVQQSQEHPPMYLLDRSGTTATRRGSSQMRVRQIIQTRRNLNSKSAIGYQRRKIQIYPTTTQEQVQMQGKFDTETSIQDNTCESIQTANNLQKRSVSVTARKQTKTAQSKEPSIFSPKQSIGGIIIPNTLKTKTNQYNDRWSFNQDSVKFGRIGTRRSHSVAQAQDKSIKTHIKRTQRRKKINFENNETLDFEQSFQQKLNNSNVDSKLQKPPNNGYLTQMCQSMINSTHLSRANNLDFGNVKNKQNEELKIETNFVSSKKVLPRSELSNRSNLSEDQKHLLIFQNNSKAQSRDSEGDRVRFGDSVTDVSSIAAESPQNRISPTLQLFSAHKGKFQLDHATYNSVKIDQGETTFGSSVNKEAIFANIEEDSLTTDKSNATEQIQIQQHDFSQTVDQGQNRQRLGFKSTKINQFQAKKQQERTLTKTSDQILLENLSQHKSRMRGLKPTQTEFKFVDESQGRQLNFMTRIAKRRSKSQLEKEFKAINKVVGDDKSRAMFAEIQHVTKLTKFQAKDKLHELFDLNKKISRHSQKETSNIQQVESVKWHFQGNSKTEQESNEHWIQNVEDYLQHQKSFSNKIQFNFGQYFGGLFSQNVGNNYQSPSDLSPRQTSTSNQNFNSSHLTSERSVNLNMKSALNANQIHKMMSKIQETKQQGFLKIDRAVIKESDIPIQALFNRKVERIRIHEYAQKIAFQPIHFQILESCSGKESLMQVHLESASIPKMQIFEFDVEDQEAPRYFCTEFEKITREKKFKEQKVINLVEYLRGKKPKGTQQYIKDVEESVQTQELNLAQYLKRQKPEKSVSKKIEKTAKNMTGIRRGDLFEFTKLRCPEAEDKVLLNRLHGKTSKEYQVLSKGKDQHLNPQNNEEVKDEDSTLQDESKQTISIQNQKSSTQTLVTDTSVSDLSENKAQITKQDKIVERTNQAQVGQNQIQKQQTPVFVKSRRLGSKLKNNSKMEFKTQNLLTGGASTPSRDLDLQAKLGEGNLKKKIKLQEKLVLSKYEGDVPESQRLVLLVQDFLESVSKFDPVELYAFQVVFMGGNQAQKFDGSQKRVVKLVKELFKKYQLEIIRPNLDFVINKFFDAYDGHPSPGNCKQDRNHIQSSNNSTGKKPRQNIENSQITGKQRRMPPVNLKFSNFSVTKSKNRPFNNKIFVQNDKMSGIVIDSPSYDQFEHEENDNPFKIQRRNSILNNQITQQQMKRVEKIQQKIEKSQFYGVSVNDMIRKFQHLDDQSIKDASEKLNELKQSEQKSIFGEQTWFQKLDFREDIKNINFGLDTSKKRTVTHKNAKVILRTVAEKKNADRLRRATHVGTILQNSYNIIEKGFDQSQSRNRICQNKSMYRKDNHSNLTQAFSDNKMLFNTITGATLKNTD